jgi:hypothetical protein
MTDTQPAEHEFAEPQTLHEKLCDDAHTLLLDLGDLRGGITALATDSEAIMAEEARQLLEGAKTHLSNAFNTLAAFFGHTAHAVSSVETAETTH